MFGYVDSIADNTILKDVNNFKVVWNGDIIWVANYIKILSYDKSKLVLKVKGDSLTIMGENITIAMLQKKEIVIRGSFYSVGLDKQLKTENNNV